MKAFWRKASESASVADNPLYPLEDMERMRTYTQEQLSNSEDLGPFSEAVDFINYQLEHLPPLDSRVSLPSDVGSRKIPNFRLAPEDRSLFCRVDDAADMRRARIAQRLVDMSASEQE